MRHTWTVPLSNEGDGGGSVQGELPSGCKRFILCHKKAQKSQMRVIFYRLPVWIPPTLLRKLAQLFFTQEKSGNVANYQSIGPHQSVRSLPSIRNHHCTRAI